MSSNHSGQPAQEGLNMRKNEWRSKELIAENKAWSALFKAQEAKPYNKAAHDAAKKAYEKAASEFSQSVPSISKEQALKLIKKFHK
jgi:hypothetical protein